MITKHQPLFFLLVLFLGIAMCQMGCKSTNNSADLALEQDSIALAKQQKIAEDSLKTVFLGVADSIKTKIPSKASTLNEAKGDTSV